MSEEIGYQRQDLGGWASIVEEAHEKNPKLQYPASIDVFDQMRREDSQVGSVLRAVTLPIRSTPWSIDPAGCRPEVAAFIARNLGLPVKGLEAEAPTRTKGRFSWGEHLRHALLELVYGHSYFEQVYQIEGVHAVLRKLAWRPPRTISKIDVATDGGLVAIEQYGISGSRNVRIPADRLVAYVNDREGPNWIGESLLRTAYKNWLLKDRILRVQGLTVDRNGLGVPWFTAPEVPEGLSPEEAKAWLEEQLEEGKKIAKQFRAGDQAGGAGANGSKMELLAPSGKLPDTDGPIRYHDEQIARAVLAHFLNLGTETGSWALGSTFANFFTDSLNAQAEHIRSITQQHVVEDLVDVNFGSTEPAPQLSFAQIGSEHPVTAEAIKSLIDCGALKPDALLEAHVRALWGLPLQPEAGTATTDPGTDPAPDQAPGAAPDAGPAPSDADKARFAAETAQKVYLAVGPVLDQEEARDIVRRAGADLKQGVPHSAEEGA